MEWLEITVSTQPRRIDRVCEILEEAGADGLVIEDEAQYEEFLEENKKYWDYVDEEFAESIKGLCRVKFYTANDEDGKLLLETVRTLLPEEQITDAVVRDEDWENNWKAYYKPIPIGERLLVVPEWEEVPEEGRVVLKLDPGLIFGTGSHATTQMCLKTIEKLPLEGKAVLDLGCGSGILAIAALLCGAESAVGCDIDPKAPDVVRENAALNGIGEELQVYAGDCLGDTKLKETLGAQKYAAVFANIVADVILALAPQAGRYLVPGGVFLTSGIIDGRQDEVEAALKKAGFAVEEHLQQDNWHCFVCRA